MNFAEGDWIYYVDEDAPDSVSVGKVVGTVHYHNVQQVVFTNRRKQLCSSPVSEVKKLTDEETMLLMFED